MVIEPVTHFKKVIAGYGIVTKFCTINVTDFGTT